MTGQYDDDAAAERAVFRDGTWHVEGQEPGYLGLTGDAPVVMPSAIHRRL